MTATLSQFQQAFAQAVWAPLATTDPTVQALTAQPAFAVYRNTVMKACVDALEANFPAVARLMGPDWFRAAAALYVAQEAPSDARLLYYGDGFAEFLRGFEPAADLPYLPGVAELDAFWRASHAALDAPCADAAWVAQQPPEHLATLMLTPHPAARWAWFDAQPVYSIWHSNRQSAELPDLQWRGEGALLTRPGDAVTWQAIPQAGCVWLDACANGLGLAQAAEAALAAEPDADMAALFALLLRAGAFTSPNGPTQLDEIPP